MSKQVLRMKYHPAKKEVEFQKFQSDNELQIPKDSKLRKYMNKKGNFVLQDHGKLFFDDIAKNFDGEKQVNIQVTTTKNDFEDFKQMIEYYNNESNDIKIDATLLAELPDMEQTYGIVKEHGEKSIGILKTHINKFFEVPQNNEDVKTCIDDFTQDINKEIKNIKDKISATAENNVNICFTGVYSAGKSSLINAILGYAVLPESIKSETSKMFRIQSPKKNDNVRVVFSIRGSHTDISWNKDNKKFEFYAGPQEDDIREAIQEVINLNADKVQHVQLNEIFKLFNNNQYADNISSEVSLYFPISIDNDQVQFTIYDTPGTDSNYGEHQTTLQDALSDQTHSILIFVAAPDKIEGEGNNALLNYIKQAEQSDSKTSIDIGRSLFVINKADTVDPDARIALQTSEIKNKEDSDFSIKLSDKKLFFVASKLAYASKSKKNGVSTKTDEFELRKSIPTIDDLDFGRYYQQNRCATSEFATNKLVEVSNKALEKAKEVNDELEVVRIGSGLHSLENEMVVYGEKFASAVKAYAIIDSVDRALSKLNTNAESLKRQNEEDIVNINNSIENLQNIMTNSINKTYKQLSIPNNSKLPTEVLSTLRLDPSTLNTNLIGEPISFIEKLLKGWFFSSRKVTYKENHKKEVVQKIKSVLDDFTRNFLDKRQKLLTQQRDSFISGIKGIIQENGEIDESAKKFLLDIIPPKINKVDELSNFGDIYDSHKRTDKILFIKTKYVNKDEFIKDIEEKLSTISLKVAEDFERDYKESLESILCAVKSEFTNNLDKYSVRMRAKLSDKKNMELLKEKILNAADDLKECQTSLESIIWSVKNNG